MRRQGVRGGGALRPRGQRVGQDATSSTPAPACSHRESEGRGYPAPRSHACESGSGRRKGRGGCSVGGPLLLGIRPVFTPRKN